MREYGYLEKMLDILTDPYTHRDLQNIRKNRKLETNIGKLFSLLADGFEVIHKNAELVRLWDDLENAEGAVLDRYGANFGVQRGAASDALYRILIRVKMLAQLSGGDGDTVIRAAGELLGVQFSDIELQDVYPAKVALYVDQSLLSEERLALIDQIAVALKRILTAGVGLRLYLRTYRTYRYAYKYDVLAGFVDLSGYVEKEAGKGLSDENFTAALKDKLDGIAAGANKYVHPTHTAAASGLYKTTVDEEGHVTATTPVTKDDITNLGIPAKDTTYGKATAAADGLMAAADKSKLDGMSIATDSEVSEMLAEVYGE